MARRARMLAAGCLLVVLALLPRPPEPVVETAVLEQVWNTAAVLDRAYVASGDVDVADLVAGAVAALVAAAETAAEQVVAAAADSDKPAPEGTPAGYDDLWYAWTVVAAGLAPEEAQVLADAAVWGMVRASDDPRAQVLVGDYRGETEYFEDDYEGIGALVEERDGRVTITQPFPGGPAARAGVRAGDVVVAVDGRRVAGMELRDVIDLVRGPAGSRVRLLLVRQGVGRLDVTVVRQPLELATAGEQRLPEGIGYLHVTRFTADAGDVVAERLEGLRARGVRAVILDLRANAGGRPSAALAVADHFLDAGPAYIAEDLDGVRREEHLTPGGLAADLPMAVLVDERTRGAAEIVAAAFRDQERAPLIGRATAGDVLLYRPEQVGEHLAVVARAGRWYPAAGDDLGDVGLAPDADVELQPADLAIGYDRQQAAAYAYLWTRLGGAGSG